MKFTLSKKQWHLIGKKAGWTKIAENQPTEDQPIVEEQENTQEYPWGMSDKAKKAFDILKQGINNKKIFNVDINEIKNVLSREFEDNKLFFAPFHPLLDNFLYTISFGSLYSINGIKKYVRDTRKFLKENNKEKFETEAKTPRQYPDDRAQKILDDWDIITQQAEEWCKNVETWSVISDLLKEAKPYIVMGRKPIDHGPDYIPPYEPPHANPSSINIVQSNLSKIVEEQKTSLINNISERQIATLEKYNGSGLYDDIRKFLRSNDIEHLSRAFTYSVDYPKPGSPMKLSSNYKQFVLSSVEQMVQDMITRYLLKNTAKIAPIISTKGEPSNVKVAYGHLTGWGLSGSIYFEFADGTSFTVNNQAIMKFSSGGIYSRGKLFYQFPTTFHNVKFKDGSTKAMVSEEDMNEKWAKN